MSVSTPVKPTGSPTQLPPSAPIARVEANVARWLAAHSVPCCGSASAWCSSASAS